MVGILVRATVLRVKVTYGCIIRLTLCKRCYPPLFCFQYGRSFRPDVDLKYFSCSRNSANVSDCRTRDM